MNSIRRHTRIIVFGTLVVAGFIFREAPPEFFTPLSIAAQPSRSEFRSNGRDKEPDAPTKARISRSYGALPMLFEANHDQIDARVRFIARGGGYTLFLSDNEATLRLRKSKRVPNPTNLDSPVNQMSSLSPITTESAIFRMRLIGANHRPRISGLERLQTTSNYFVGDDPNKWRTNVANFARVKYEAVYPGVDVIWYGNQGRLEHDFIIAPGADPGRIKLLFDGANAKAIDSEGALVLRIAGEELRLLKPLAWQEENGERREVECRYRINRSRQVEFRLGDYDRRLNLVIDPVLAYSTYIGGAGVDRAFDIAVDGAGFAYITGQTDSADFPGPGPIQPAKGAQTDVFVLKLNQTGDAIIYGAWLGGDGADGGAEIEVDGAGAAVITGSTNSNNFPTKNALQPNRKGETDAFVAKLNSTGDGLIYSTYLGGALSDSAGALAVDANGNAYVTGFTDSLDFPLKGAFQNARQGGAFHVSDNAGGLWKASAEGLGVLQVYDIAIDPANPATIYAGTDRGVFKSVNRGASWSQANFSFLAFQVVIDPAAPANVYALTQTFIYKSADGGATWNSIPFPQGVQTLAISPTAPASTIFAATANTFFRSVDGGMSWASIILPPIGGVPPRVFSVVVDPTTPAIVYAGGINGVYRSADGGTMWAPLTNGFPQNRSFSVSRLAISKSAPANLWAELFNVGAYKTANGGSDWTAVGLPAPPTARLVFAIDPGNPNTIYAGALGFGIYKSVDGGGTWNAANNGLNNHTVLAIVVAPDSLSTVYAGTGYGSDAFVAKINATGSELVFSSYLGGGGNEIGGGIAVDHEGAVYVTGLTDSQNFPVVAAYQPTNKGRTDAFVTKINPTGSAILWSTYLGGAAVDIGNDIAVHPQGFVFVAGATGSTDFPTVKAIQSAKSAGLAPDVFVSRFSADGANLDFSTYIGGGGDDQAFAIAVDGASQVYLTGATNSIDFPVLNAVQATRGGTNPQIPILDAFVTKLDTNGAGLIYSTYLGGNGPDLGNGVATDGMNAYVTGQAFSSDFPTTPNPLRATGFNDSFITKIAVRADLAIAINDLPDPVMVNNNLTYTLTVTNNGPDAAHGVTVTDTLPAGVDIVSANASQGVCGSSNPITCAIGSIALGAAATVTIVVKPTATGSITNRATVTSDTPDANESNNSATQGTRVSTIPSIFGRVATGTGAGLGEVSVALTGEQRPAATTATDGAYQFAELPAGANYTVTPSRQGYVFNPGTRAINDLRSDQRADFEAVVCAFSISPLNQTFSAIGGVGSVTVTGPDPRCPWTARSEAPWIKITSAPTGNGNGMVTFSVDPTVGSRIGAMTIAGVKFTVSQEFNACDAVKYQTPPIVSTLSGAMTDLRLTQLLVKDFNNDGLSDLVQIVSQPEVGVSVSLSDSRGGYEAGRIIYRGQTIARSLRAGDLNNDGKNDLMLITSGTSARLLLLFGDGAGGFSAPVHLETVRPPLVATIADFNNDNKPDIAVGTGSLNPPPFPLPPADQNVSIHLGDGAGGFAAPRNFTINASVGSYLTQMEAGDFNGDGKKDLAALGFFGSLAILTGDGVGNFTASGGSGAGLVAPVMALGDFNGDGKTDIAISYGGAISLLISTAAGPLQSGQALRSPVMGSGIVAADFNGDGKSDIAAPGGVGVVVVYAIGNGAFAEPVSYLTGGASTELFLGDSNNDGRDDLFVPIRATSASQSTPPELAILTANAQGGFDAPRSSRFATTLAGGGDGSPSGPVALIEDFNGDGVKDLAVAFRQSSWRIVVAPGSGRGEFISPVSYFIVGEMSNTTVRDINRDGKPDIVFLSALSDSRRLEMLLNDGAGGFTQKTSVSLDSFVYSIEFADFNNDGNLDLIVSSQIQGQPNGLSLYLGDGRGDFTKSSTTFNVNINQARFVVGDFNGDRNSDLAVFRADQPICGAGVNPLSILFGDGRGAFSAVNLSVKEWIAAAERADFNRDGQTDLIFTGACPGEGALFVMLADAQGRLASPVRYETNGAASITLVNDFNNDGRLDVMMKGASDRFLFFLGKDDGGFGPGGSFRAPANSVAVGDLDGDGSVDLVLPQNGSGYAAVLPGETVCATPNFAIDASAANYAPFHLAPESIAALFGAKLAAETQTAPLPLPTMLAGASVKIKDSAGVERLSSLFYVSPQQINHLIPTGTAPGVALITVTNGGDTVATGTTVIGAVSPGIFTTDSSGQGLASALVLRVKADGSQVYESIIRFDPSQNRFVAIPIDVSDPAEQVFLVLFGTGVRNYSARANVSVKIGGENAEVQFAGAQSEFAGVDQINARLSRSLAGRGEVEVVVTVDGRASNTVKINIK